MGTIPVTDPHKAWNVKQFKRLEAYNARLQKLLDNAIKKAAAIAMLHDAKASDEHLFSFSDDRQMKAEADKLMKDLSDEMTSFIKSAEESEWKKAYEQAAAYIGALYKTVADIKELQERSAEAFLTMRTRNLDALEAFRKRKIGGLSLSEKVWNYTQDFGRQMEVAIDTALMQGKSAAALSRDIRSLLTDPNALFRRVRDENDQLRMSKAMEAYHPGTGRYRSAYKNAMRLAISEINMAYRASDCNVAMMSEDCVGIEIHLSNNHNCKGVPKGEFYDICDQLAGKYPKDFQWTGWHPQCHCFMTYVLKTDEEHQRDIMSGTDGGSVNTVKDVPDNFKEWVKDNEERIARAKQKGTEPYFLKDNEKYWKDEQYRGLESAKLGRKAAKEAYVEYENSTPIAMSKEVEKNVFEAASKIGVEVTPMTFLEADSGRANDDFLKDDMFRQNCQCCVVVHEARLRGLDITALPYSYDTNSIQFKLGDKFQMAWINPKNGKTPEVTIVKGDSDDAIISKLGDATKQIGRYHIGLNTKAGIGHVIVAERMQSGKIIYYDAQSGNFININEYEELEKIEVLKVDKLIFDVEILKDISRPV